MSQLTDLTPIFRTDYIDQRCSAAGKALREKIVRTLRKLSAFLHLRNVLRKIRPRRLRHPKMNPPEKLPTYLSAQHLRGVLQIAPAMRQPFLQLSEELILATTLFERNGVALLRLWNSLPKATETDAMYRLPLREVHMTDIFGKNRQAVELAKGSFIASFAPFEMKTLVIGGQSG